MRDLFRLLIVLSFILLFLYGFYGCERPIKYFVLFFIPEYSFYHSAVLFVYGILHGCETRKVFGRFVLFSLVFASVFFPAPGDRSLCNMIGVRDPSSPCIIISLLFNHF